VGPDPLQERLKRNSGAVLDRLVTANLMCPSMKAAAARPKPSTARTR